MNSRARQYGAALVLALMMAGGAAAQGDPPRRGVSGAAREGAAAVMAARGDPEAQAAARDTAREGLEAAREAMQADNAAERPADDRDNRGQGSPEAREARAAERAHARPADETPEARETRRGAARTRRWNEVRERTGVGRPEELPEAARAELTTHARREARLRAIRQRAVAANDTETVTRVDAAFEREDRRHDGALTAAAAQARGDEHPNDHAADGQARAEEGGAQ